MLIDREKIGISLIKVFALELVVLGMVGTFLYIF